MTWRERIARAEHRGRWVPAPLRALIGSMGFTFFDRPWPFTRDDLIAWRQQATCLAGEVARESGLDSLTAWPMFRVGIRALNPLVKGNPRGVGLALDEIEDLALALKREAGSISASATPEGRTR